MRLFGSSSVDQAIDDAVKQTERAQDAAKAAIKRVSEEKTRGNGGEITNSGQLAAEVSDEMNFVEHKLEDAESELDSARDNTDDFVEIQKAERARERLHEARFRCRAVRHTTTAIERDVENGDRQDTLEELERVTRDISTELEELKEHLNEIQRMNEDDLDRTDLKSLTDEIADLKREFANLREEVNNEP